jgi:hypothetical protein
MIMVKLPNDLPFSDLFENKSKNKQDELWANAHLWYPRSLANRK